MALAMMLRSEPPRSWRGQRTHRRTPRASRRRAARLAPHDFETRAITGVLTGAVLAALDDDLQNPAPLDSIKHAIDHLGTGFPLAVRFSSSTP